MKLRFFIPLLFIIFLGGCKPSQVFVARSEKIPFYPWLCVEDTQFVLHSVSSKLGIRYKTKQGNYIEKWWRFPDDVYCTWAKGFIYDVQANTSTGFLINDKRQDKELDNYYACGDVSLFTWKEEKQIKRVLRDTLDMEVCGKPGIIPMYEGKYLVFFPKYAGITRYVKQYKRDYVPVLIVKVNKKTLEVIDSIKLPLPVHSLRKISEVINVEHGFNENTLVLGFEGLDTMVVVRDFQIKNDKAVYSEISFVKCPSQYASPNFEEWKTLQELQQEPDRENAVIYEGLKRTYFEDIYYDPKKKRWYRLVQIPFYAGKLPENIREIGLSYKDMEILIWNKNFRFLGSVRLENKGKYAFHILGTSGGKIIVPSPSYKKKKELYYLDFK